MDAQSSGFGKANQIDGPRNATHLVLENGGIFGIGNCEATRHYSECRLGAGDPLVQAGHQGPLSWQARLKDEVMRDKLSKREDRALLRALRAVTLTQFPTSERK